MNIQGIFYVGLGGAIGAVCRYFISLIPVKTEFPFLTLLTNFLGAVFIGIVVGIVSTRNQISENQVLFWKTGICGGFTTFSTFSLEGVTLLEQGKLFFGGSYIILSVLLCLGGVMLGRYFSVMILGIK